MMRVLVVLFEEAREAHERAELKERVCNCDANRMHTSNGKQQARTEAA